MAEKIESFGASIPPLAANQLKVRQKIFSKSSKNLQNLQAINSNAAWVVLRSSVDEVTNPEVLKLVQTGKEVNGKVYTHEDFKLDGGAKAKDFILTGGRAANFFNKSVQGVNLFGNYDALKTYNKDERLGVRPMPGITGLKVASKNTYGTLLQAEVNFVVWSLEDLERAELLFLRPGYSALLEWGHSVYYGIDENDIQYAGKESIIYPDQDFFRGQSMATIDKQISEKRDNSYGNYDGMFGYITNFNWSFRADGGYDCGIKIVSRGVILESLSVGKTSDMTKAEKKKEEEEREKRKSKFHYILVTLEENKSSDNTFSGKDYLMEETDLKKGDPDVAKFLQPFDVFKINQQIAGDGFFDDRVTVVYLPMRAVLDIINTHFNLKDPLKNQTLLNISTDYGEKYITFPQHISVDPMVAIMPKIPSQLDAIYTDEPGTGPDDYTVLIGEVTKNAVAYAGDRKDDIMNIMVASTFVKKCISKLIDGPQQEGAGVLDFIDELLSGISNAFGEVNDLSLFYDHDVCTYRIVDRRNTGTGSGSFRRLQQIELTGLSSTVTEIGLESKITSKIASQVSIAAQGNSGNYKDNVESILKWNAGAIDRHIPIKTVTSTEGKKKQAELKKQEAVRRKTYIENLREAWYRFNAAELGEADNRKTFEKWFDQTFTDQRFDSEEWNQLRQESIAEMNRFLKENPSGPVPQGVVPVELSLKMLGITGFKIGTAFKIKPGLLPSKYDKFAYIITGLDHDIGTDNKWYTNIKTQFYAVQ